MDLEDILHTYSIPYTTGVSNGFINICCPFCSDTKFHMGWSIAQEYFTCFKCGWHAKKEVFHALLGTSVKNINFTINAITPQRLNTVEKVTLPGDAVLSDGAKRYLEKRKYDVKTLQTKYNLMDGGIVGNYSFRIIIPVYKSRRLVTFTSRGYKNQEIRYLHLSKEKSICDCKSTLYNADSCFDTAVVLEGPADVWRWGDGAVCTFGTGVSEPQLEQLSNYDTLHFIFDNEDLAQQKAKKYAEKLAVVGCNCYVHRLDEVNDIGDCTPKDIIDIKNHISKST